MESRHAAQQGELDRVAEIFSTTDISSDNNNNNKQTGFVPTLKHLEENSDEEEDEKIFKLVSPHKTYVSSPGQQHHRQNRQQGAKVSGRVSEKEISVILTGMDFNPPTDTLMLTTKTVIGTSVTYAVSQLRPSKAPAGPAASALHHSNNNNNNNNSIHHQKQHSSPAQQQQSTSISHHQLSTLHTCRYHLPALEHHGDLRVTSCGRDAPGELVCAGSDRSGSRHGVFRLQALTATSQPVLAQCCGPTGDRLGQFNRPAGCAVDSGSVYVADRLNHRVQRLALPTLAPLAVIRHPGMFRPSHLAVFSDRHYARRLLLIAHERGVVAFDLQQQQQQQQKPDETLAETAAARTIEFARGTARRWGGICVHWGAVLIADQDGNCIRVYRYRPEMAGGDGGFGLVQRLHLEPLGLCLPREVSTHRWMDLLFVAAHDSSGGGDVCVLTARLARIDGDMNE